MTGNINKIRSKLLSDPMGAGTLQDLILSEAPTKTKTATQGLLWLSRGLEFTSRAMRETVNNPDRELTKTFTDAYTATLSQYHGMLIKPVFKLAMEATRPKSPRSWRNGWRRWRRLSRTLWSSLHRATTPRDCNGRRVNQTINYS